MDRKTVIVGIVLIFLGIGGFFLGTKLTGSSLTLLPTPTPTPLTPDQKTASSLNDLLASDTARECTFENDGDMGIVYVSGERARLDYDSTWNNGKVYNKYHMVIFKNDLYIWKDEGNSGFHIPTIAIMSNATPIPTVVLNGLPIETGGFFSDANYNYECRSWHPDISFLTTPPEIDFIEAGFLRSPRPNVKFENFPNQ